MRVFGEIAVAGLSGAIVSCVFSVVAGLEKTTETRAKSIRAGDAPAPILRVVTGQCSLVVLHRKGMNSLY